MADITKSGVSQGLLITKVANLELWCSALTSALLSSNLSGIGTSLASTIKSTYAGQSPTISLTE